MFGYICVLMISTSTMASAQIQCEMCRNENAVGYCKTCGNVGETCIDVHKTVNVFLTHMVSMNDKNNDNQKVIRQDITEERCKQHPTERTIFLCKIHDSMLCGRCFHSEHPSCFKEVVDLLHEDINIDCDKVNTMKSLFNELKAEILFLKDEAEHSQEKYKDNADTCVEKCMELGNKIKQRVDELTRNYKDGIREIYEQNVNTFSHITKTCVEKTKWCANEESKIDDYVDNNMAGRLYLVSRHFEKEVSDARSHLKEIKHKHTFKGIDFKENKVILKCVFEDLEEVCEQQEEVTGSDDGQANDVVPFITEINKTRRELATLLKNARNELDESEKTRQSLRDELKQVQQDLDNSEKKRQSLRDELKQVQQDLDNSEKKRQSLRDAVQQVKQDLYKSETTRQSLRDDVHQKKQDLDNSEKTQRELTALLKKSRNELDESEKARTDIEAELKGALHLVETERAIIQERFPRIKKHLNWTQPTGTVGFKTSIQKMRNGDMPIIELEFTFPDGIQTTHHPSPGKPYKGGTFTECLSTGTEGQLLCRMLKAAFRRGVMFNIGKDEKVVLDGVTLYNGLVYKLPIFSAPDYDNHIRILKWELSTKGITEANIDQTEVLYETFTVDGR
ncbi:uncharacterized protein LOC128240768 isoform X3 [Mya arenaria]|uniref:uncharacterized protein LOC128240768 isoform X3 n=1 Tax=Mya arenaria TaxID=6604 RepID=UPI0022E81310|nr:uncharacterized protein LOC128240768 isoform X3 [Mya arenaria]